MLPYPARAATAFRERWIRLYGKPVSGQCGQVNGKFYRWLEAQGYAPTWCSEWRGNGNHCFLVLDGWRLDPACDTVDEDCPAKLLRV